MLRERSASVGTIGGICVIVLLMMSLYGLTGCSNGQSAQSGSSSASASASESSKLPQSVKQKYVGTWELVEIIPSDGDAIGQDAISAAHDRGLETFLNLSESKALTFNCLGKYDFGVWNATNDSDVSIRIWDTEASSVVCDGNSLSCDLDGTKYSFVKGEPKDAPDLLEFQELAAPFIGTRHMVKLEVNGDMREVQDGSVKFTLDAHGKCEFTFDEETHEGNWMPVTETTGKVSFGKSEDIVLDGSQLIYDYGDGYKIVFEKD